LGLRIEKEKASRVIENHLGTKVTSARVVQVQRGAKGEVQYRIETQQKETLEPTAQGCKGRGLSRIQPPQSRSH